MKERAGPGQHATAPKYARGRRDGEARLARKEKQTSRRTRKPQEAQPQPVATARGAHSRGYQGVVINPDGTELVPPCGHRHKLTVEARDCVDPAKEYR